MEEGSKQTRASAAACARMDGERDQLLKASDTWQAEAQKLAADLARYKDCTGKSAAELEQLSSKALALEVSSYWNGFLTSLLHASSVFGLCSEELFVAIPPAGQLLGADGDHPLPHPPSGDGTSKAAGEASPQEGSRAWNESAELFLNGNAGSLLTCPSLRCCHGSADRREPGRAERVRPILCQGEGV